MGDLLYSTKRKTRTSDFDQEAKSPLRSEESLQRRHHRWWDTRRRHFNWRLWSPWSNEQYGYINKQLKLILSKLEGLETKLETVIETINQLKSTVNKPESAVEKVEDAKQFKKYVTTMDKEVSFLNSDVEELKSEEKERLKRILDSHWAPVVYKTVSIVLTLPSDYRKITMHSKKVCCGPISSS